MLDMAGYFGLNILLWAGIVTLASPPMQPPAAPQCSYTLKPILFGFRLTIRSSTTAGLYTLTLRDQDNMTETTYLLHTTYSYFSDLKPCTSYRHRLSLTLQHSVIDCNQTVNTTATLQPKMEDFQNVEFLSEHICYQSKWNIRSLLTQPNNMQLRNDDTFCIRYDLKDICTNFTTNVSTSCGSFPFTKFINLDPSHITMRPLGVYPAKIEPTFPPNCKNWTVEHVCSEKGSPHQYKSLSELEPYTDYSCAAVVTRGTVSMRTQDVDIRIECNLIIYECSKSNVLTNTSMNLHWNLTSSVCKDLFTRFNFSYDCYCDNDVKGSKDVPIKSQQVSCSFSALDAFKDYTCGINVKYKKFSILDRVFRYRTEPGIPERPPQLHLDVHEHNQITVKVDKISRFNGPSEFYIVRLYEDNEPALIRFLVFLIITSGLLILVAYKIYTRRRKRSR